MTYVTHIACWRDGERVANGVAAACEPGDYPEVHYDLARIAGDVDRDAIARGPASLWRYGALLPAEDPADAVSLGEGWTPLLQVPRLGQSLGVARLLAKDEGRNPSGTFANPSA